MARGKNPLSSRTTHDAQVGQVGQVGDPGQSQADQQPEAGSLEDKVAAEVRRAGARIGSATVWRRVLPSAAALAVMLIFIFQNLKSVQVSFISLHGRFPLALALLFAAILGALTVAFAELSRTFRLRRRARREEPGGRR